MQSASFAIFRCDEASGDPVRCQPEWYGGRSPPKRQGSIFHIKIVQSSPNFDICTDREGNGRNSVCTGTIPQFYVLQPERGNLHGSQAVDRNSQQIAVVCTQTITANAVTTSEVHI